jgi:hypothetical protein
MKTISPNYLASRSISETKLAGIIVAYEPRFRRTLLLIAMYALPIIFSIRLASENFCPDVWWHLRTGEWIVKNLEVPTTDMFSIMKGTNWIAYSWLYEILLYAIHSLLGLTGFVVFGISMSILTISLLYSLLRTISGRIALSVALTGAGIVAMGATLHIRSFRFSILFLILELYLLHRARTSSNFRHLLLLPLLFSIWANLHIQFVFGLFVYALFALEVIIDHFKGKALEIGHQGNNTTIWVVIIGIACAVATLLTPYNVSIYLHLIEISRQTEFYKYVSELQALGFRTVDHWITLLIILSTIFLIGRRRIVRPTSLILFAVATALCFHSARDAWFAVVIGLSIIASCYSTKGKSEESGSSKLLVTVGIIVVILIMYSYTGVSNELLEERLAEKYPVRAAQFMEDNGLRGPIYNHFNWGGYLIWRLPGLLVSMDGRGYLYGGRFEEAVQTWMAKPGWCDDLDLLSARTILASPKWPLASVLRLDSRFELVYEDEVSLIFVPTISGRRCQDDEGSS